MTYDLNYRCGIHNLRFACDRYGNPQARQSSCPECSRCREVILIEENRKLREQRDLFIKAIDLARLVQQTDEK